MFLYLYIYIKMNNIIHALQADIHIVMYLFFAFLNNQHDIVHVVQISYQKCGCTYHGVYTSLCLGAHAHSGIR